jgi:NTE family protein
MAGELKKISFLGGFEPEQFERLLWYLERLSVEAGDNLISAGELDQSLYVVTRGRFAVTQRGLEVDVLEAGQVVGELAFFSPAPRSATVRALEDGEILRLTRERYEDLRKRDSALACALALEVGRALAERFRVRVGVAS